MKKQSQFLKGQNDIKVVFIMGYEDSDRPGLQKNKPNQSQSPSIGRKSKGTAGQIINPGGIRPAYLKKQSQFAEGSNGRKASNKNALWSFYRVEAMKKQTQSKPISRSESLLHNDRMRRKYHFFSNTSVSPGIILIDGRTPRLHRMQTSG